MKNEWNQATFRLYVQQGVFSTKILKQQNRLLLSTFAVFSYALIGLTVVTLGTPGSARADDNFPGNDLNGKIILLEDDATDSESELELTGPQEDPNSEIGRGDSEELEP